MGVYPRLLVLGNGHYLAVVLACHILVLELSKKSWDNALDVTIQEDPMMIHDWMVHHVTYAEAWDVRHKRLSSRLAYMTCCCMFHG